MKGSFYQKRDIPALVNTIADWNAFIAAGIGAFDELSATRRWPQSRSSPISSILKHKDRTRSRDSFGGSRKGNGGQ